MVIAFSTVNKPSPVVKQQQQSAVKESRVPIIIVPATTSSSVITVYNVVDFLQDYKLVVNRFAIDSNCQLFISGTSVWRKRKTTVRKEKQR